VNRKIKMPQIPKNRKIKMTAKVSCNKVSLQKLTTVMRFLTNL